MGDHIMTTAKIEFSFGHLKFTGEGNEDWIAKQLDKVLAAAPTLSSLSAPGEGKGDAAEAGDASSAAQPGVSVTLASHIKAKGAESNQNLRFLVTADWLRLRGAKTLNTAAVSKALLDNQQKRLGNPSECLNQNVSKGHCEKTADGFYITPEGLTALGHKQ